MISSNTGSRWRCFACSRIDSTQRHKVYQVLVVSPRRRPGLRAPGEALAGSDTVSKGLGQGGGGRKAIRRRVKTNPAMAPFFTLGRLGMPRLAEWVATTR